MSFKLFIEPREKIIVNCAVTFIQGAAGVLVASYVAGTLNKLVLGAAAAAGLSAMWNLTLKPYLVLQGWLRG